MSKDNQKKLEGDVMINLTKTKKKSATEEIAEEQEMESDALNQQLLEMLGLAENPEARSIMLMGDLTEEKSLEIITALIVLSAQVNAETGVPDPIKIYVSTYGGSADEMFGIYDVMNMCKEKGVIIETVGLGKVMSAGTLILSAGSKGHRKIGKHTRVMIHAVAGGSMGGLHSILNEMEQMKGLQDSYIQAISNETELSKKQVQGLINRKVNVYLSAEEAIEKGLADGYM
jgi:ATP-dependent Clp protease protease subunit